LLNSLPMPIQTLPKEVINLIAAGEVIDSLVAVVRELVENSLDAITTRIVISVNPHDWSVEVADNGTGISGDDLFRAALPHTTSKIFDISDLTKITSLGFRGEALHSLAHLADLVITSRLSAPLIDNSNINQDDPVTGWQVEYDHAGLPTKREPVAIAPGTIVRVNNLFSQWPVRRKGIGSASNQLKAIQTLIQNFALCHPQITWQIYRPHHQHPQRLKLWYQISPADTPQQILGQFLRLHLSDLQYRQYFLGAEENLQLVLGLPDRYHRHRPDWVKVAINGRVVRSPELEQTILTSLSRTCPRQRFPIAFLHLQINPIYIDWHRHPAKLEVYLENLPLWQAQTEQMITDALQFKQDILFNVPLSERVNKLLKVGEEQVNYHVSASHNQDDKQSLTTKSLPNSLLNLKAIAQLHNTYIVAEHPDGIWLIEQHIAHERILYEQLCDRWQLVAVEPAIILKNLAESQISQLTRINIEVEPFGEDIWAVRHIPAILAERSDRVEAILELSRAVDLEAAQVATACRSAIKNGESLTLLEMQNILNQWQQTKNPRTCPHGRPIYLPLAETSLARFFRRSWVIGKSHGLF